MKDRERGQSRIATEYEPVQPTNAQQTAVPMSSRVRKPSLGEMGPGTDRAIPARSSPSPRPSRGEGRGEGQPRARSVEVDSRAKAGAFGEKVKGPHKPTLDEMGPHASLPLKSGKAPAKPTRTVDVPNEQEKKSRRGRPRKTGRPGR